MIRHCRTVVLLVSLVCVCFTSAGEKVASHVPFQIQFDLARFYGDEHQVYVEMYYGIPENILTYNVDSGRISGAMNMKYVIRNDSSIVSTKEWLVPHSIDDSMRLHRSQVMTGLETIGLSPGNYTIVLKSYDVNDSTRQDSITMALPVQFYPKDKEVLSDVELCSSIQSSSNQSALFYKNTLEAVPNPSRMYGTGVPIMYYYFEVYNLTLLPSQPNVLVHTVVVDAAGREVLKQDRAKPRLHASSVEVGTFNLSPLKSGTYTLRADLLDTAKGVLASTSKKFFVYKPGMSFDTSLATLTSDVSASEYKWMNEEELDREFAVARYTSTDDERVQYSALKDVSAKRKFLFDFWDRRKGNAASLVNELKEEYFKRVSYANSSFGTGFREGWKTDRGRVYIVYGSPDEVERFPSSAESNPYEIWHYNSIQGGVMFAFVDRNSLGEYTLVHSTHRDEIHDENWYNRYAVKTQ